VNDFQDPAEQQSVGHRAPLEKLRDELFSGSMFDFRMYSSALPEAKIKRILQWGSNKLGMDNSFTSVVSS
jgi:hypothetical protein